MRNLRMHLTPWIHVIVNMYVHVHTHTHVHTTINIPTLALIHVAESDSWCVLWSAHLQSLCKYIQWKYSIGRIMQYIFTSIVHSWRRYSLVFKLESTLCWFCYSSVCYVSFIRCFGIWRLCVIPLNCTCKLNDLYQGQVCSTSHPLCKISWLARGSYNNISA